MDSLPSLLRHIGAAAQVMFLLDYDGTLTPIVSRPEAAILSERTRDLLGGLAASERAQIAVLSGRSLADVRERVGLDLIYAGNHGLEIEGACCRFVPPGVGEAEQWLRDILPRVRQRVAAIPGVIVEDKRLTASVHYRLAPPRAEAEICHILTEELRPGKGRVGLREGKKVFELVPLVNWNKGHAARWILDNCGRGALPVCLGDDATDEHMFQALPDGITISVGASQHTAAGYYVESVDEALRLLSEFKACLSSCDLSQTPR